MTVAFVGFWFASVLVLALVRFRPDPVPVKTAPDVAFVESVVQVDANRAYAGLAEHLQTELQRHPKYHGSRVSTMTKRGHRLDPRCASNSAYARYRALPPPAIAEDLYVRTPFKGWESEYFANGKPLRFLTNFVIHLESLGRDAVRIEVIEVCPMVVAKTRFRPIGRHLVPEFFPVWVRVPPTTKDREDILEVARRVASADSDGKSARPRSPER